MLVEAEGGPRAADAHEWLGRHFAGDDDFRAKLHFSEAARLAPERCSAWQALAEVLERGPHPREALAAWDTALETSSDAQREEIRRRRATLEARVRQTRTPLDAVAERIGATSVDAMGRTQRHEPFVAARVNRRVHAFVALSLMHGWVVRIAAQDGLVEVWEKDADVIATASALIAKSFHDDLRPFDVARRVLEVLRRDLPDRVWHLDTKLLWITDGSVHVVVRAAAPNVIHVSVEPKEADGIPEALACATDDELVALETRLVAAVREAATVNDAYRVRPLGVRNVAPRLAAALRSAGISPRSCVPAYRFGPGPAIALFMHEDVDLVMLQESRDGLVITIRGTTLVARSYSEFERDLPALVLSARKVVSVPLDPGIALGRCYEVVEAFADLAAGERVKVISSSWDHGDEHWFVTLAMLASPTRSVSLGEEILAAPSRFLRRIPSESVAGLVFD